MPTPLQERMLAAAELDAGLQALLGTSPMRWYFDQLPQGSAFPAVVATQISGSKTYGVSGRLPTGFSRFQFMVWGGPYSAGARAREDVQAALVSFFDSWSGGIGISGLSQYPNREIGERESIYFQQDTPIYQKILDFEIFSNDTL